MKLHVYYLDNADGTHSEMVAAENQREACDLMGTSRHHFRQYGGQKWTNPEDVAVAMSEPKKAWKRKIMASPYGSPNPWVRAWTRGDK